MPDSENKGDFNLVQSNNAVDRAGCAPAVFPAEVFSQCPRVEQLTVTKSSRVQVGPKFISVTQHITNNEVVKEVPFWKYVIQQVKSSSRAERVACGASALVLLGAAAVLVYFTVFHSRQEEVEPDAAPHPWNITREMWLGMDVVNDPVKFRPLRLVIINHSVSPECHSFVRCAVEMRNLQDYFLNHKGWDLPYNFVIGNDGRVYEGRGWAIAGAHHYGLNSCSLGVGFIGDYRPDFGNTAVTALQEARFHALMQDGIRRGFLDPDFVMVGARDFNDGESPGENLLRVMLTWPHYDKDRYYNKSCAQIYS